MATLWLKRRNGQALLAWAAKGGSALVPYDQYGEGEINDVPLDKPCKAELRVYNGDPALRRLFYVIVGKVAKGMGRDKDGVVDEIKVRAGHCDTFFIGEHTVKMPKTISEKKGCDEMKFKAFFDAAMVALADDPFNIDPQVIEDWIKKRDLRR